MLAALIPGFPARVGLLSPAVLRFIQSVPVVLALVAAFPAIARAADAKPLPEDPRGTLSVTVENDRFAKTDRHYTNGFRLGWLSATDDVPDWANKVAAEIPTFPEERKVRIGYAFGQNMYTPTDSGRRDLITTDRPYAGWLYGGATLLSETADQLDTVELDIGMIGPWAFAKQTQSDFHALIGVEKPQGWGNQLSNEPGVDLIYERKWRKFRDFDLAGLQGDIMPHLVGSLGNVFTYAGAGATIRLGDDLRDDYGAPRIRPALGGSSFFRAPEGFGWYVFAGFEGRAVARDITLDGNTFGPSHSYVNKEPFVLDGQLGFAIAYRSVRLTYSQVFRSKEYDGQPKADSFGSLSLSVKF